MTPTITHDHLVDLVGSPHDADRVDLGNGFTATAVLTYDDFMTGAQFINDMDESILGGVADVDHDRYTGKRLRPDGFDDNAEVVNYDRGYEMWWQPPPGVDADSGAWLELRSNVRDVLEFGPQVLVVTVRHDKDDGYHRTESAALGGIEPYVDRDYLHELTDDLLAEALDLF